MDHNLKTLNPTELVFFETAYITLVLKDQGCIIDPDEKDVYQGRLSDYTENVDGFEVSYYKEINRNWFERIYNHIRRRGEKSIRYEKRDYRTFTNVISGLAQRFPALINKKRKDRGRKPKWAYRRGVAGGGSCSMILLSTNFTDWFEQHFLQDAGYKRKVMKRIDFMKLDPQLKVKYLSCEYSEYFGSNSGKGKRVYTNLKGAWKKYNNFIANSGLDGFKRWKNKIEKAIRKERWNEKISCFGIVTRLKDLLQLRFIRKLFNFTAQQMKDHGLKEYPPPGGGVI